MISVIPAKAGIQTSSLPKPGTGYMNTGFTLKGTIAGSSPEGQKYL